MILSIYSILNIFVRVRPAIFVKSIEYPKFSSRNPLKLNEKYFRIKKKRPRYFNKRFRLKLFVFIKSKIYSIRKNKK
jgi:hypothetical protein